MIFSKIFVSGVCGSGKTTFINSLLGTNLETHVFKS